MSSSGALSVAVIGAGASGIMALIRLKQAGFDKIACFEKAEFLGGTWRDNTYPGVACDVPSHAYRYSFAPNADWSQMCAPGAEILDYLAHTAEQYNVDELIQYNSEITNAEYKEGTWTLETADGVVGQFDAVVTATGVLHHPIYPDIPDQDLFEGPVFHSARWPKGLDLAGKNVGIIGTGSTAVQITAAIVDEVANLSLFQRTAQWIFPQPNKIFTDEDRAKFGADPGALDAEYHRLNSRFNYGFAAAIVGENPEMYDFLAGECKTYLETVQDPDLRQKLTPDYEVGCKRLIMSDTFYEAIQKPNAELVTVSIESFCREGIRTSDNRTHQLDAIVLATGFNTHQLFRPMNVTGIDGKTLDNIWKDRNQGYLTVSVPEFPNWFMIGGPTSPIGNFSWLLTAETQFSYILKLLEKLRDGTCTELRPTPSAARRFNEAVERRIPDTIWASGCQSWYIDQNGNVASWPWSFKEFQEKLSEPEWEDFQLSSRPST